MRAGRVPAASVPSRPALVPRTTAARSRAACIGSRAACIGGGWQAATAPRRDPPHSTRVLSSQAMACGVPARMVQGPQRVLREREQANAPLHAAAALVDFHTKGPPLEMDLVAAERALAAALAAGVGPDQLEVCGTPHHCGQPPHASDIFEARLLALRPLPLSLPSPPPLLPPSLLSLHLPLLPLSAFPPHSLVSADCVVDPRSHAACRAQLAPGDRGTGSKGRTWRRTRRRRSPRLLRRHGFRAIRQSTAPSGGSGRTDCSGGASWRPVEIGGGGGGSARGAARTDGSVTAAGRRLTPRGCAAGP